MVALEGLEPPTLGFEDRRSKSTELQSHGAEGRI